MSAVAVETEPRHPFRAARLPTRVVVAVAVHLPLLRREALAAAAPAVKGQIMQLLAQPTQAAAAVALLVARLPLT
jgi:hypothetical protein